MMPSATADRADRLDAVDADRHHRRLDGDREGEHVGQPRRIGIELADELPEAQRPARLGHQHQQDEVDRAEQQHRIGHIMFEQPDHRPRAPPQAGGAGGAVSVCVSFSDTAGSVG